MEQPESYPGSVKQFLELFRKKYSGQYVVQKLKSLKDMKVLMIGETILDEYHHVQPIGKPPKGNHIAARYLRQETHAGGVLACANHMASFCERIDLLTVIGSNDDSENFVKLHLKSNVNPQFFYQNRAIVKRRFIDQAYQNKLFEVYENEEPFPADDIVQKIEYLILRRAADSSAKYNYDLVLILDYGHNLFDRNLVRIICGLPYFLAVNAQTNTSNFGYNLITKYPRANYFCLDEWELRLAYQDRQGPIEPMIHSLGERTLSSGAVSVTRGHLGSVTYNPKTCDLVESPIFSKKVVDTTGAGDAFLAVTAPCVAKGFPIDLVSFIGNTAGALAVGYLGNTSSIEAEGLYQFIENLLE